jgi:glycosyltransferase involved in cell wall biosynthesis
MQGDVTLVITTYNPNPEWFRKCLDSIPRHLFAETIICDDGSSSSVANATFRHEKNQGIVRSLNDLFERVQTKWVAQLGHDDWFEYDGVMELVMLLDAGFVDADVVHWPYRVQPQQTIWNENDPRIEVMLDHLSVPGASWITKAAWSRIGRFQYDLCEDWEFWIRAVTHKLRFHYFPKIVYNYRSDSHGYWETVGEPNRDRIVKEIREMYGTSVRG